MTGTRRWLETERSALVRRFAGAGLLLGAAGILAALAIGVLLGRLGFYQRVPLAVFAGWITMFAAVGGGVIWYRRRAHRNTVPFLAGEVERSGGLRRGSIAGAAAWEPTAGSTSLAAAADRHAVQTLERKGRHALADIRGGAAKSLWAGALMLTAGAALFAASLRGERDNPFWHPLSVMAQRPGHVSLAVDRRQIRRGESITAAVRAPGRRSATLWSRAPGEPWSGRTLVLDSAGAAIAVLGPLDADRYLRAVSDDRSSDTVHVRVALPAFLVELQLLARYPEYLDRPDEPLVTGREAVLLPVGTRVSARGQATVELDEASWRRGEATIALDTDGRTFRGGLVVRQSGRWYLMVKPAGGDTLDEAPPELNVVAVPDSVPIVTVPVPGADTTAPLSLTLPLVIDARDDHSLSRVELVSWRVTRLGERRAPAVEEIPLGEGGRERAVLQWVLDLNGRGFLPGDTAYFKVRARDNAPASQVGESRAFKLRLPSLGELRQAMRQATDAVAAGADSLTAAQRELARSIEDLAAERERGESDTSSRGNPPSEEQLPFSSVERARELADRQQEALDRARQLRDELRELQEAAWNAGLTDPEFQRQLRDLQALLDRAVTEEIAQRLQALRAALERLDATGAREALEELAEAAQQLRDELERGRELFERAAIEGEMTTLAQDADELARRQQAWNREAERGVDADLARAEQDLAARADSLAQHLAEFGRDLDTLGQIGAALEQAGEQAGEASRHMQQAAGQAGQGQQQGAQQSGESASQQLDPLSEQLRQQRDQLRQAWQQEVLDAMDRALVEAADLAQRQEAVEQRLNRGESGGDLRGEQAAVRDGVERVIQRVQTAAGKNALVSPQLGSAIGYAKLRMDQVLEQLQRPVPNSRQAGERAGQAVDALNAAAHALLRTRGEVAGAQSGSGLQEALERMAQLAEQQGAINSATGQMQPLISTGGDQLMQQLRSMASQQRSLANQLDRLNAEGEVSGADQLADAAREIAGELESGRLDQATVERQERLYHRLLDAGRTLRKDEEDEREERVSETADPTLIRPPPVGPVPEGDGPRFRYPTWEELRSLSPEERRLILDYFRRLNDARP